MRQCILPNFQKRSCSLSLSSQLTLQRLSLWFWINHNIVFVAVTFWALRVHVNGRFEAPSLVAREAGSMGKRSSLSIKAGLLDGSLSSDMDDFAVTSKNAGRHLVEMVVLGSTSVSILRWLASIAAIYLLILDRTNWRTNILTGLLVPYIFLNLPSLVFNFFRGEVGRWIAFIAIVLRLFFPRHFPEWLELPGALILLLVAAPSLLANNLRASVVGYIISLLIGVYLLQEHIRAAGGFRKAFSERNGVSNTIGIILLFASPLWELIRFFL